jgi:hypothetical protein
MGQILNVFFWLFLPFKNSLQVFYSKGINILDQLTSVEVLIPLFGAVEHHVLGVILVGILCQTKLSRFQYRIFSERISSLTLFRIFLIL